MKQKIQELIELYKSEITTINKKIKRQNVKLYKSILIVKGSVISGVINDLEKILKENSDLPSSEAE